MKNSFNSTMAKYRNAAINEKVVIGASKFYQEALEVIRSYKNGNSHKVPSIQAYCNFLGIS